MLTLAAITVYFVGLMTFDSGGHQFIVPQATDARSYDSTTLIPHHASIIIKGLENGEADCNTLHGTWTAPQCVLDNLSGTVIELPAPMVAMPAINLAQLPKPRNLCGGSTHKLNPAYITDSTRYAALVPITGGTLDACSEGDAWFSRLIFIPHDPAPVLTFKKGLVRILVQVKADAVLQITNDPDMPPADKDQKAHFFWFYTMFDGPEDCSGVPLAPPPGSRRDCHYAPAHLHYMPAGTGVGCSNTNYP